MMNDLPQLLRRFSRGEALVSSALAGLTASEADYRPAPKEWTIRQVTAHLADSELVGSFRFRSVIAGADPALPAYDEARWAEHLDYSARQPQDDFAVFRQTRRSNYLLLAGLNVEAFTRSGTHSERGPLTLYQLLTIYTEHAEGHARQIRRLREQFSASLETRK